VKLLTSWLHGAMYSAVDSLVACLWVPLVCIFLPSFSLNRKFGRSLSTHFSLFPLLCFIPLMKTNLLTTVFFSKSDIATADIYHVSSLVDFSDITTADIYHASSLVDFSEPPNGNYMCIHYIFTFPGIYKTKKRIGI
jgi:hypothetical protein